MNKSGEALSVLFILFYFISLRESPLRYALQDVRSPPAGRFETEFCTLNLFLLVPSSSKFLTPI